MKRIVLVRTMGPRNAGMVMRAVANFGPAELWFVAPDRPSLLIHPEFDQMSHGVENVRARIRVVETLDEALADCHLSLGFTARARGNRFRADWREVRDVWVERAAAADSRVAFVFGSEENGLTKSETDRLTDLCFLATSSEHTSINLAMAVGIVLSSMYTEHGNHALEGGAKLISGDTLEYLKRHLKDVFGGEIARGEAARRDIEDSIERIFTRAPVETRDARAWHLVLRALGNAKSPADYGLESTPRKARRNEALDKARARARDGDETDAHA